MAEITMDTILTSVGSIVQSLLAWAQMVITTITSNPLLLFLLLVFTVGGGVIGIVNRLIRG